MVLSTISLHTLGWHWTTARLTGARSNDKRGPVPLVCVRWSRSSKKHQSKRSIRHLPKGLLSPIGCELCCCFRTAVNEVEAEVFFPSSPLQQEVFPSLWPVTKPHLLDSCSSTPSHLHCGRAVVLPCLPRVWRCADLATLRPQAS